MLNSYPLGRNDNVFRSFLINFSWDNTIDIGEYISDVECEHIQIQFLRGLAKHLEHTDVFLLRDENGLLQTEQIRLPTLTFTGVIFDLLMNAIFYVFSAALSSAFYASD